MLSSGLERQQVDDRRPPGVAFLHRDLVGPQPVDLAPVGEQQQVRRAPSCARPGRSRSSSFSFGPLHPAPPRRLRTEGVGRDRLDVTGAGEGDDDLLVLDQVLDVQLARVVDDPGPAFLGVLAA